MMLYHACWDMMFLFGIWMDWYIGNGRGVCGSRAICWVFILLSGFCAPLWDAAHAAARCYRCLPPERWSRR